VAAGTQVKAARAAIGKAVLRQMDKLEGRLWRQGRRAARKAFDGQRKAPLPGGGRLVAAMAFTDGADPGDAAIGVEPVMRLTGGRGEKARADHRTAVERKAAAKIKARSGHRHVAP